MRVRLRAFFTQRVTARLVILAGSAVAAFVLLEFPTTYRAEASLYVRGSDLRAEAEILTSPFVANRTVDAIGLSRFPVSDRGVGTALVQFISGSVPPGNRARAAQEVSEHLDVVTVEPCIIRLGYAAATAEDARAVLENLINVYREHRRELWGRHKPVHILQGRCGELRSQMTAARERLRDLKDACGIASPKEAGCRVSERIGFLMEQIGATEASLAGVHARIATLEKLLTTVAETTVAEETLSGLPATPDVLQERLAKLKIKEAELLVNYKEQSTPVKELRMEIADIQGLVDKATSADPSIRKVVNPTYQFLKRELLTAQAGCVAGEAEVRALRGQLDAAYDEIKAANARVVALDRLTTDLEILRVAYAECANRLEEARNDEAVGTSYTSGPTLLAPIATVLFSTGRIPPWVKVTILIGVAGAVLVIVIRAVRRRRS